MEKIKIRALILDYGGVISKPQNPENVHTMLQILKQDDADDFRKVYESKRANYDNGQLSVASAGKQGSHILSAISRANCYIVLPAECAGVKPGEQVEIEPFSALI